MTVSSVLLGLLIYFVVSRGLTAVALGYSGDIKTTSITDSMNSLMEDEKDKTKIGPIFAFAPIIGDFLFVIGTFIFSIGIFVYIPARLGALLGSLEKSFSSKPKAISDGPSR